MVLFDDDTICEVDVEAAFDFDALSVGATVALLGPLRALKLNEELKLECEEALKLEGKVTNDRQSLHMAPYIQLPHMSVQKRVTVH